MTYQMLTGRVPFTAETPIGVLMKHLTEPLPIPPENVALSPELSQVLQRVLARSAADRFSTVKEYGRGAPQGGRRDAHDHGGCQDGQAIVLEEILSPVSRPVL